MGWRRSQLIETYQAIMADLRAIWHELAEEGRDTSQARLLYRQWKLLEWEMARRGYRTADLLDEDFVPGVLRAREDLKQSFALQPQYSDLWGGPIYQPTRVG